MVDHLPAGDDFKASLLSYMRPLLVKGVPSLINELRSVIYSDPAKTEILGSLLTSMNAQMERDMSLDEEDEEEQDPTVQLWLYYYLS